jgi:hypothetical protein
MPFAFSRAPNHYRAGAIGTFTESTRTGQAQSGIGSLVLLE